MTVANDPVALGATLYLPATRSGLAASLVEGGIAGLRSAVICLEDAVAKAELPAALRNLARLLRRLPPDGGPRLFVRPRGAAMLAHIACLPGADRLAGFVLPKVTADTLPGYLAIDLAPGQLLMPTLETREVFDSVELRRLRERLLAVRERILLLRIGGNDLLQAMGLRRARTGTLYDGPLGPVVARLAGEFLPWDLPLSAPVMERYDDPLLLAQEVARDIDHGLLTKTAIHPAQVAVIQAALAVGPEELSEARRILSHDAPAVFAANGAMCEPATHRRWARLLVHRAGLFGVAEPLRLRRSA